MEALQNASSTADTLYDGDEEKRVLPTLRYEEPPCSALGPPVSGNTTLQDIDNLRTQFFLLSGVAPPPKSY